MLDGNPVKDASLKLFSIPNNFHPSQNLSELTVKPNADIIILWSRIEKGHRDFNYEEDKTYILV